MTLNLWVRWNQPYLVTICYIAIGWEVAAQWLIGVSWLVSHYDSLKSWGRVTHGYESPGLGFVGEEWVYKAASRHSVVSPPHNHLSTILPTITLYDFPSLLLNMRTMLYDRTTMVVGYYIQHRQELIDRHLLNPSSLGLLQWLYKNKLFIVGGQCVGSNKTRLIG